jgi:hypothetical protein
MISKQAKSRMDAHVWPHWAYDHETGDVCRTRPATGEAAHCVACHAGVGDVLDYGAECIGNARRGGAKPIGL